MKVEWRSVALQEVAEIERDTIEPSNIVNGTTFIGLENIEGNGSFVNVRSVISGELASNKFSFTNKHVLYGKLRPYLSKIARPTFNGVCSTDILPILPSSKIDRDYLTHFLRQPSMISLATSRSTGANLPRLSPKVLAEFLIPLPPIAEQKRTAAILDKAEELRSLRRKSIEQLEAIVQSIFLEMFGNPVVNPKGWQTSPLRNVCSEINDCPHSTPAWTESGIVCLRTSNLTEGSWNWKDTRFVSVETYHDRSKRGYIQAGDIVLSREGTVGIAAIVTPEMKVCMGQRLVQLRPSPSVLTSEFVLRHLLYVLAPTRIATLMVGSTSQHLNVKELKDLSIPLPPFPLQQEFAQRMQTIEQLKTTHRESLAQLDALFASLQHRAFRGEL